MSDFVGFVGSEYTAASPTQDAQELINWYPEVDSTKFGGSQSTGAPEMRGVIALYPCSGLLTRLELPTNGSRGTHVLPGGQICLWVAGNKLYSITTAYVATAVGTLLTSTGRVYITDNGVSAYLTDGANRYYYTWSTSTFAVTADGAFAGGSQADIVDNFIIYNRPGFNQWGCTNVGSIVSNPLNLGSKLIGSDNIVAIISDHRQVLLIGDRSGERWTDVGTFPFPFAVVPGTSMQHGTEAPDSIARLGEGIAFLAQDDRGTSTVVMWGATFSQPVRISTFAVENAIQQYRVSSDAIAYSYSQAGHEFYVLTFPTADVTWCYDLSTQLWHKRAWRDSANVLHRHRSHVCAAFNEEILVGDWQNGKIYALDQFTYTDDGAPLPCIRRAPHLTSDLKRQFFSSLQIQFQPGVGVNPPDVSYVADGYVDPGYIAKEQAVAPQAMLRWSDDGGFTFGNTHAASIGLIGQYRNRAIWRRMGYGRDRVYELTVTDPVYRVVVSADLTASAGAN